MSTRARVYDRSRLSKGQILTEHFELGQRARVHFGAEFHERSEVSSQLLRGQRAFRGVDARSHGPAHFKHRGAVEVQALAVVAVGFGRSQGKQGETRRRRGGGGGEKVRLRIAMDEGSASKGPALNS